MLNVNPGFSAPVSALALLALSVAALAQHPEVHPDLQGNWTNASLTPLERPGALAGKLVFSEPDAAEWEKRTRDLNNRDRRDGGADTDVGRAYNELFFDQGSHLSRFSGSLARVRQTCCRRVSSC
jgi:hypothetical protein